MLLINWLVLIALLGGPRLAYRLFKDRGLDHILERVKHQQRAGPADQRRDGADMFIREMRRDPRRGLSRRRRPRPTRHPGRPGNLPACPMLGTIDELDAVVEQLDRRGERPQKPDHHGARPARRQIRRLLDRADALGDPARAVAAAHRFRARPRRPERALEPIAHRGSARPPAGACSTATAWRALIAGRRVLVTGAGGTIGAELTRQIAASGRPARPGRQRRVRALHHRAASSSERFPGCRAAPLHAATSATAARIDEVIAAERPEIVFHAAALKHVPMVEANPIEGVLTNVRRHAQRRRGGARRMASLRW